MIDIATGRSPNLIARRNTPRPHAGKGRKPLYGEKFRPLPSCYKGKTIAVSAPDRVETWTEDGVSLRAEIWENLILPDSLPGHKENKRFDMYAIYDPDFDTPWLHGRRGN